MSVSVCLCVFAFQLSDLLYCHLDSHLTVFVFSFLQQSVLILVKEFSIISITSLSDNIRTHEIASIFNFIIIITTTTFFSTNTNAVNAELRCGGGREEKLA